MSREMDRFAAEVVLEYTPRGVEEGLEKVWPDAERRARAIAEGEVKFRNQVLPVEIEQTCTRLKALEQYRQTLLAERNQAKRVQLEGETVFNYWSMKIGWVVLVLAELLLFPIIFREAFDFPMFTGVAYGAVFMVVTLVSKTIYVTLGEKGRLRFSRILIGVIAVSLPLFVICLLVTRVLNLASQRQVAALSLSGTMMDDSLIAWQWCSLTGLWLLGASCGSWLAVRLYHYYKPEARMVFVEQELKQTEEELRGLTDTYALQTRDRNEANSFIETFLLAVRNKFATSIAYEQARRAEVERLRPTHAPQEASEKNRDGKTSAARFGATATMIFIVALLASPVIVFADLRVFFVQDLSRPAEVAEREFQGFGRVALSMPAGTITLLGSDGVEYVRGTIEDSYTGKMQRQRQVILGQARAFYLRLKEHPGQVRDYGSALSEILSRPTSASDQIILIIQGNPLYRLDPVDWNGKIPSLSWIFHPASPFGEQALLPAKVRFRAAIIFSPEDFVTPGHRLALQKWWTALFQRLNGMLALFTTDSEALPNFLSGKEPWPERPQLGLLDVPSAERQAPLRLEEVVRLGVTR